MRRACSIAFACACAVAGLVGCSSGPGQPLFSCYLPPGHAHALDVTTAGRVRWQVPVALPGYGQQLAPLAAGAVAVFAQGGELDGLRLADGHRAWSWASSQEIAGLWRWQGLVVVLAAVPGSGGLPLLAGLDASTGKARWTLRIAAAVAGFYPTADGGLAIVRGDGALEVADLSTGRIRWAGPPGLDAGPVGPVMAVAGGALLVAVNGRLTSYDDQTGRVRWADTLISAQLADGMPKPGLQVTAGLVYLSLTGAQGPQGSRVLGISAADGRVEWRFAPGTVQPLNVYAPGLVSVELNSGDEWLEELDPATGRVRWRVAFSDEVAATPAGVFTGSEGNNQVSLHDPLTGQNRWVSRLNGIPAQSVFPDGPLLIVPAAALDGADLLVALRVSDGHRAWQVTIPESVAAPLSAVPGGLLVYTAHVPLPC